MRLVRLVPVGGSARAQIGGRLVREQSRRNLPPLLAWRVEASASRPPRLVHYSVQWPGPTNPLL
jgi:hypothetical protein